MLASLATPLRAALGDARKALIRHAFTAARLAGIRVVKKPSVEEFLSAVGQAHGHGLYELRLGSGVRRLEVNRAGIVRVDRRWLPEIDYGVAQGLTGWSPQRQVERCIHLWSHRWLGYYHWLIDVAPKICAAQEVYGRDLDGWKLCWPKARRGYEEQTLALLEVPPEATLDTQETGALSTKALACVPIPWYEEPPHPNIHLLRRRLAPRFAAPDGSRIFITRTGARACTNQPELLDTLAHYGFQPVDFDGMLVSEQVRLVSAAETVGGIHGAGLSNILWCQPDTRVIDLLPPRYQPKWFANLGTALGLAYHPVAAQPDAAPQPAHWTQMNDAFTVDIPALRRSLDRIL